MRAPVAYYMMILYFTVMFKPLIPIVSDALSHTFAEAIHIATVHAIYGSNHLQKELADTGSENSNGKHQHTTNGEEQVQLHISANTCVYDFNYLPPAKNYSSNKLYKLFTGFIVKHTPPPKFC